MARVTQIMPSDVPNGVPEKAARFLYTLFWAFMRVFSILLLLAAWEILARSLLRHVARHNLRYSRHASVRLVITR